LCEVLDVIRMYTGACVLAGVEQLYNLLTVVLAHYTHSQPDEFTALL